MRCAHDTGIDRVELRRQATSSPPMRSRTRRRSRCNTTAATTRRRWTRALKAADYAGFEARRTAAAARGKLRGIGVSTYLEACGIAPSAVVGSLGARAGPVRGGEHPRASDRQRHGVHRLAQPRPGARDDVRAAGRRQLGVPIDQVEVVHGDTAKIPFGMGTYGSRSLAVGGSAMVKAMDKIIAKGKKIAAHLMEASVDDIEFKDNKFTVAGTDKAKTLTDISLAAYVPHNYPIEELEPGLDETAFYDPKNFTFPGGCHVAEVEIDPDTGVVAVVNFVAVDDVGRVINPMIVEGQVQGGVAQGIGQALLENAVYDKSGQLLSGSMMDYTMPRADNLPNITRRHRDHAVHAQSAGREGLRRGRRDRLAAGDHQRGGRCAEGLRRAAHRHAGERTENLVDHPGRPAADGGRVARERGDSTMYDFAYQKPGSLADAVKALGADAEPRRWPGA